MSRYELFLPSCVDGPESRLALIGSPTGNAFLSSICFMAEVTLSQKERRN